MTVPFTGGTGEALIALLGGRVEATSTGIGALGQIQAGKLRVLALFQPGTHELFPGAISVTDAGYGETVPNGNHVITSKGVPKNVLDKLVTASLQVLRSEEYLKFAKAKGFQVTPKGLEGAMEELLRCKKIYADLKEYIEKEGGSLK